MDTIQRESLFYPVTARQDWTPLPFTSFRIFTNAPHGHGIPQHQHGDCINRHMLDTSFTLCNPIDRGSGRSVNGGDSKLLRSGGVGYCLAGGRVLWMMKNGPLKRSGILNRTLVGRCSITMRSPSGAAPNLGFMGPRVGAHEEWEREDEDGKLDLFQPSEQLRKKKKISYIRRRQDVYKTLGPGTKAGSAAVVAFGSLFTSPYRGSQLLIDITGAPVDQTMQSLIEKIDFLSFVPEIVRAGKEYAEKTINAGFLCAQLRLLDGWAVQEPWEEYLSGFERKDRALEAEGIPPYPCFCDDRSFTI
ncbi:hypothetical protein SAY86_022039 [Trapa natans]|uniref:Uncharacterized protein n=1 Tax=Trapa natans TaxID=22666 RepID=A0AAN7MAY5_TRANT|nr:hypothetical protein SAY86_022039 [Trapa natans]